jgi:hypothetical protein
MRSGEFWCSVVSMVRWHVLGAIGWRQLHAPFRHDDSYTVHTCVMLKDLDIWPSGTTSNYLGRECGSGTTNIPHGKVLISMLQIDSCMQRLQMFFLVRTGVTS